MASRKNHGESGWRTASWRNWRPNPLTRCSASSALTTAGVKLSASTAWDQTTGSGSFPKRSCRREVIDIISRMRSASVRGQIYVSPLDLGRRNGLIEQVHRPTLRVATTIFADDGKPFGIFMINLDMRRAFDRVRSSVPPGETIYVVNRRGDYLIHPDRSREFGWLLGKPNDWKADFPHLAPQVGATQGSADIVPDQAARLGGDRSRAGHSGGLRVGRRHRNHPQRRGHGARPRASGILRFSSARSPCCARQCWRC